MFSQRAPTAGKEVGPPDDAFVDDTVALVHAGAADRPPPTSRHAPTRAGRAARVRKNIGLLFVLVLGADERADRRRADRAVVVGEPLDHVDVETARLGDP